jgi:uncharacterized protein (TIGR00369 family)
MNFDVHIPFVEHLGFELLHMADGQAELRLQPRPEHLNSFAVVHGGVLMTLLDVAMAMAARSRQPEQGAVTVAMTTQFMQAAQGPLLARARLLHQTATLAFTEASVLDAKGRACAAATGTFKLVRRLPTGARHSLPLQTIATD